MIVQQLLTSETYQEAAGDQTEGLGFAGQVLYTELHPSL